MTTKSAGVETVNSFITPKGVHRTLQVETYENGNVEIEFTVSKEIQKEQTSIYSCISLNRREALALIFYLIRILLPNKFLTTKWKKKEEKEEEEKKEQQIIQAL